MLREYAKKFYLEQKRNCAESILMAANAQYGLGLSDTDFSLLTAFGGGMGCGGVCGALSGAMAVLGNMYKTCPNARKDDLKQGLRDSSAQLVKAFTDKLSAQDCATLKAKYHTEAFRCLETVQLAADVLEAHMASLRGEAPQSTGCTVSAADIKRVKGLGFLNCKGTNNFNCRVITRNGKINNAELQHITDAAKKFGNGEAAMTTRLTIEIQGIPYENIQPIQDFLALGGLSTGGTGSKVRPVVSCKGTTCQYGLYDTFALSQKVHKQFYEGYHEVSLPHKFKIALGGCPNNCVKPDLNDIGIIGQRVPGFESDKCRGCKVCAIEKNCPIGAAKLVDGKLFIDPQACNHCGRCVGKCPFKALETGTYGWRIALGGRWGKKVAQGRMMDKVFLSEQEVLDTIEKAILLFRDQGISGERFADTVARLGFEAVQAQLLSDELLRRKAEILGLNVVGGASC